ncbi:Exodeoxyribonuclease VII large subunit [bacterium A37T11]|nr:Exodeoxyribonuclease VII large subunit [bacterium A37T11]
MYYLWSMPEMLADRTIFSLAEVARSVQKTIAERYKSLYWIKAEMNKLNFYSHSGHCYPELLEKKEGKVIAEMRSILWKNDYLRINQQFQEITKEPLKNGITILLQAAISYDPLYGMSLRIVDIDPSFSLGVLEREKAETIAFLKNEGIFDENKRRAFPLLPKRLALISVETSKGLSDFLKIIDYNPWKYRFEHVLYPALLQGEKAVSSILGQLKQVEAQKDQFDVVAIIRGGGGDVGLSCYNHVDLATYIARFPIPVLTGIGHSTNETVSEMVAYKNAITPTELADFLIQHFHNFAIPVQRAVDALQQQSRQLLVLAKTALDRSSKEFSRSGVYRIRKELQQLEHNKLQLKQATRSGLKLATEKLRYPQRGLLSAGHILLKNQQSLLLSQQRQVELLDPQQILNRGYSITLAKGRPVKSADELSSGEPLETLFAEGKITSIVR